MRSPQAGRGMTVILYRGTDICPSLPCLGEFARSRPNQSRQSRSRAGNRKRRNLTWHVCVRGRAYTPRAALGTCACALVKREGRRRRGGREEEDIESDSRRTGHNFRPTRSELLMTSLPPPHHSRCRVRSRPTAGYKLLASAYIGKLRVLVALTLSRL